jgi:predicted DNA-binding ribbon-helix-helix protein
MKLGRRREPMIKSLVVVQSVNIQGRHSSVSLESAFWNALKEIAVAQNISAAALVSKIDSEREAGNRGPAIAGGIRLHSCNSRVRTESATPRS